MAWLNVVAIQVSTNSASMLFLFEFISVLYAIQVTELRSRSEKSLSGTIHLDMELVLLTTTHAIDVFPSRLVRD